MRTSRVGLISIPVIASLIIVFLVGGGIASAKDLEQVRKAIIEKGARWTAGETSVSKLSAEEKAMRVKLIKPSREEAGGLALTPPEAATLLPNSLSWTSPTNYVTPVRDQGNCGSCWAFATVGALESYLLILENKPSQERDMSEQVLISCGKSGSCSGGYINLASSFIRDTGLPLETCYPYLEANGICKRACRDWRYNASSIGGWQYVAESSPTVDAIKNALYTYGPLVTTMDVYNDFFYYEGGVYSYVYGGYAGGHAILIVGYDNADGYFLVKNSWGTGWGEGGFFKIAYSELNSVVQFGDFTIAYSQPTSACAYTLNPASLEFTSKGGKGSFTVTVPEGCRWTAASDSAWIKITSETTGIGSGTVVYSVSLNKSTSGRTGHISVSDQVFTVTQAGK